MVRFLYKIINNNKIINLFLYNLKLNLKLNKKLSFFFINTNNIISYNFLIVIFIKLYKYNFFFLNNLYKYYFFINSSIYNFYLNDIFFFLKNKNKNKLDYFSFLFKNFKKKRKKKKVKIRKRKFFRFKKRKFFRFKKIRKHFRIFRLKKKRKQKNFLINYDLKYVFFYNFFKKVLNLKFFKQIRNNSIFYFSPIMYLNNLNFFNEIYFINFFNEIYFNNFFFKIKKKKFFFKKINIFFKNKFTKFKYIYLFDNKNKIYNFKKNKFNFSPFNFSPFNFSPFNFSPFNFSPFNFSNFFKKINLKIFKKKKKRLKKKFKKNRFFYLKLVKKKRYTHFKKRKFVSKQIFIKKKHFLIKSELYKIFLLGFLKKKKFNKNIILNSSKILYNPYFFFKNFFFKRKIKRKNVFFNLLKNSFFKKSNLYSYNISYNNYFPIYNSHYILTKKFKKIFKSILFKKYYNSMQYYVISFFEFLFKKKFLIKSISNNFLKIIFKKKKIRYNRIFKIFIKNKRSVLSRTSRFNLLEIIEIVFYSLYFRDVYILKNWFLRNFNKLHYKNQKKFLFFFKIMITDIFETYKYSFGIKGFYFILRGKVGVTSNAKRKTVFFRIGPLNKSTKNQKIDFQQGVVKANSGTSGLLMILTYI